MICLLYNLGTSEFGQEYKRASLSFREYSARLAETNQDQVGLVILDPILATIGRENPGTELEVRLFATDQVPPHSQDTIFAAKIVERQLQARGLRVLIESVAENPSEYDTMNRWFAQWTELRSRELGTRSSLYVALTAGTPQMNLGLLLQLVHRFPKVLPIDKRKNEAEAQVLQIGETIQQQSVARTIGRLEQLRYYESAGILMEEFKHLGFPPGRIALIRAQSHRDSFDFKGAAAILKQAETPVGSLREPFLTEKADAERLAAAMEQAKTDSGASLADRAELVKECVSNIAVRIQRQDFSDGIARIYRTLDYAVQVVFHAVSGIPVYTARQGQGLATAAEKKPLWKKLFQEERNPRGEPYRIEPTLPVLTRLLAIEYDHRGEPESRLAGWAGERAEAVGRFIAMVDVRNRESLYNVVAELRHPSIYAHGFDPVTVERMKQKKWPPERILADLSILTKVLGRIVIDDGPAKVG